MFNVGLPSLFVVAAMVCLVIAPFWLLLPKFGVNKWFSLTAILPLGLFILLWIVALRDALPPSSQEAST